MKLNRDMIRKLIVEAFERSNREESELGSPSEPSDAEINRRFDQHHFKSYSTIQQAEDAVISACEDYIQTFTDINNPTNDSPRTVRKMNLKATQDLQSSVRAFCQSYVDNS